MTAMKCLKEATFPMHRRLEKRLAVKHRFSELARYSAHIARLEAFHRAAETEWGPALELSLSDFPARRKTPLLAHDLEDVGGTRIEGATVLALSDMASALGAFYVLEGATLGGHHLLPLVKGKLGLSPTHGAVYLASYGSEVRAMWAVFSETVESHCETTDAIGSAISAAQTTFLALETWLCQE